MDLSNTSEQTASMQNSDDQFNRQPASATDIKEPSTVVTASSLYRQNVISLPEPSIINSIIYDKAISGAIRSLIIWGAINLGLWIFFYNSVMSMFNQINAPEGTFNLFIYGGAVIGAIMLCFAAIGFLTKTKLAGWLDGLSLIGVGIWNILYQFLLAAAVRSYGYHVKSTTAVWAMLGIAQVIWGFKQIMRFINLDSRAQGIPASSKTDAEKRMIAIMQEPESPATGRLKFSIQTGGSFPIYTTKTEAFTMWLLPEKAYCLERNFGRSFEIEKKPLISERFLDKVVAHDTKGNLQTIVLSEDSLVAFNHWLKFEEQSHS